MEDMPRAIVAAEFGGPEVLQVIEIPSLPPDLGEVVIAVRAVGVNPVDAKIAAGTRNESSHLPLRLGSEASGVVTAVGEDAVGADGLPLLPGDEVLGFRLPGAYASELTVPAKDVLHKPAELSFEQAAGLLLVGSTAAHALQVIGLREGEVLLLHGAAGSVGRAAAQLAVRLGARVIGTAAPHRHEELRGYGIEPVAYGPGLEERVRALTDRADAAIDAIGGDEAFDVSFALVAEPARIVSIVETPRYLEAGALAVGRGRPGAAEGAAFRNAVRPELVRLAAAGELDVPVVRTYPFEQVREAFEFLLEGHAGGKIILIP